jgi:hypothetical protein
MKETFDKLFNLFHKFRHYDFRGMKMNILSISEKRHFEITGRTYFLNCMLQLKISSSWRGMGQGRGC